MQLWTLHEQIFGFNLCIRILDVFLKYTALTFDIKAWSFSELQKRIQYSAGLPAPNG
jgi:hypothetical protein